HWHNPFCEDKIRQKIEARKHDTDWYDVYGLGLTGKIEGLVFRNWTVVADDPITSQEVEVSADGISFRSLATYSATTNRLSYTPQVNGIVYYRIKATSALQQTAYSNIVALRTNNTKDNSFIVSTLISNEIMVNAEENYNYRLVDVNGKMIATGAGKKGINKINMQNNASGIYVIQLINDNNKQTERIIKQ
ncbi:MAG: T9SS type A sorting domain-containing protein, partial [Pedobacter sp.]